MQAHKSIFAAALAMPLFLAGSPVLPQAAGDWLGTWSASPQPVWEPDFFAAAPIPRSLRDQTVRQIVRVSQGGDRVRVEFSNEYGEQPMVIGGARIARAGEEGAIVDGTDHPPTFSGRDSITVPPGAPVWSDPIEMRVEDLEELAISLYLPEVTPLTTWHNDGRQTAYISGNGDFTADESFGATLTPFEETFVGGPLEGYYNEEKEAKRMAVNEWIRSSGAFDGVIDFDEVVRDPENPKRIQAQYDSGDHLHPNDAGYEAMANSVDIGLLGVKQ